MPVEKHRAERDEALRSPRAVHGHVSEGCLVMDRLVEAQAAPLNSS